MRGCLTSLLLLLAVAPVWADDDPEPPATGAKELEGTWAMSTLRLKNLPGVIPEAGIKKMRLTFAKGKVTIVSHTGEEKEGTFKIDP